MKKKLLTILLSVFMIVTTFTEGVFAEGEGKVAKIGDSEYATLADAIAAVVDGTETTITLIDDVTIIGNVKINDNRNIILDLNGHKIEKKLESLKSDCVILNNGQLKITDNSNLANGEISIMVISEEEVNPWTYTIHVIDNEGTLTLEKGKLSAAETKGTYAIDIKKGTFNMTGGELNSAYCGFRIWCNGGDATANISGGTISGNHGFFMQSAGISKKSTVNVTGGNIEGAKSGIYMWNDANTNGGNLELNISNDAKIKGGQYSEGGESKATLIWIGTDEANKEKCKVKISDGFFNYNTYNIGNTLYSLSDIVEEGKKVIDTPEGNEKTDGYIYTIGDIAIAKIGNTIYPSLETAVNAVQDGTQTTIVMIDDEKIEGNKGVTIPTGKNIVLDLNGKTIKNHVVTNDHSQVINNEGTLTIKDSSDSGNGTIKNEVEVGINPGDPANGKNYTTNIIENNGIFTIVSGNLVNTATGSACYAIDNNSADGFNIECYIKGGLLQNLNYTPVRVAPTNSNTIKFEMSGGIVSGAYGIVFNGNGATDPKLHFEINGGTVNASEYAVYTGSMGTINPLEATDFSFTITGGNFGTVKNKASLIKIANIKNFISGGWFSEKVEDTYVASGYKASGDLTGKGAPNATNVYTVIKDVPSSSLNEDTKEEKTITVDVGGTSKNVNTTFGTYVEEETLPGIEVSNLNKAISATEKNNTITSAATEAKDATSPTVEVEVIMNVELAKSGKIESLEAKIREDINAAGETIKNNKIEYIDITIDKIVKANGNVIEVKEIKETDSHQIISFPVASVFGTSADKEKVFVYRNHKIDENNEENVPFTKVEKDYGPSYNIGDGECYWLDGDYIYIKAKKFSVYGFGVQNSEIVAEKKPTPTPDPDSKPRYKVPNTGVDGMYSNNYSLLKLSSLSLLALGAYMVIKKKKDN